MMTNEEWLRQHHTAPRTKAHNDEFDRAMGLIPDRIAVEETVEIDLEIERNLAEATNKT